jgi:hypothetical protein
LPILNRFSYYAEAGTPDRGDVRRAYEDGSDEFKGRFLSRLRILAQLPRREWHEGYFKKLAGECEGLWEIRFKADRVQQRPLGFHISDTEFVILFWATEKGNKFVPASACATALTRKAEVLADRRRAHALWLALE